MELPYLIFNECTRSLMELPFQDLRKLWKEWDLRIMVFLSLTLQVILCIFGNIRTNNSLIIFLVWSAYTAADSVATYALGILSTNLTDLYSEDDATRSSSMDANTLLSGLWAPFLLMHMVPDTRTAYALEDNELGWRQVLELVKQAGLTLYVFILSWAGTSYPFLFELIFVAGIIKSGERIWALMAAGFKNRRKAKEGSLYEIFSNGTPARNYEELYQKFSNDASVNLLSYYCNKSISYGSRLDRFYDLLDVCECVFADITPSYESGQVSLVAFSASSSQDAFEVTEILESKWMYDLIYTKIPLLSTYLGLGLRLITFSLIFSELVLFSVLVDTHCYSTIDLFITYLLSVVAIFTEIHAALVLLSSDRFQFWLIKNKISSTMITIPYYSDETRPKLSKMHQLSLISPSRRKREIPEALRDMIYECFKQKAEEAMGTKKLPFTEFPTTEGEAKYKRSSNNRRIIPGTKTMESFEFSTVVWHLVTEDMYYSDREKAKQEGFYVKCKSIKRISRYLLYLVFKQPSLVSAESKYLNFECLRKLVNTCGDKTKRCEGLWVRFKHGGEPSADKHDVPFEIASRLREELNCPSQPLEKKWERIGDTWMEMLGYVAKNSKPNEHAERLRYSAEFLTHGWLLMVNFGLIDRSPITFPEPIGDKNIVVCICGVVLRICVICSLPHCLCSSCLCSSGQFVN